VVGILDGATFSNITERHIMFYQDTFGPCLTMIGETLQTQLIDPEPLLAGQYIEFDLNEVLKGTPKERFEAPKAADFLMPNEKRALENRDRVDDARGHAMDAAKHDAYRRGRDGNGGATGTSSGGEGRGGRPMTPEGLRPIRCQSCGKLICEADGTVVFRGPRCKRRDRDGRS
jgi:hypothetical protein